MAVQLARRAHGTGLITAETVRAVEGVATLRNLAAHGRSAQVDEAQALDYLALTQAVSFAIDQDRRNLAKKPAT